MRAGSAAWGARAEGEGRAPLCAPGGWRPWRVGVGAGGRPRRITCSLGRLAAGGLQPRGLVPLLWGSQHSHEEFPSAFMRGHLSPAPPPIFGRSGWKLRVGSPDACGEQEGVSEGRGGRGTGEGGGSAQCWESRGCSLRGQVPGAPGCFNLPHQLTGTRVPEPT